MPHFLRLPAAVSSTTSQQNRERSRTTFLVWTQRRLICHFSKAFNTGGKWEVLLLCKRPMLSRYHTWLHFMDNEKTVSTQPDGQQVHWLYLSYKTSLHLRFLKWHESWTCSYSIMALMEKVKLNRRLIDSSNFILFPICMFQNKDFKWAM